MYMLGSGARKPSNSTLYHEHTMCFVLCWLYGHLVRGRLPAQSGSNIPGHLSRHLNTIQIQFILFFSIFFFFFLAHTGEARSRKSCFGNEPYLREFDCNIKWVFYSWNRGYIPKTYVITAWRRWNNTLQKKNESNKKMRRKYGTGDFREMKMRWAMEAQAYQYWRDFICIRWRKVHIKVFAREKWFLSGFKKNGRG